MFVQHELPDHVWGSWHVESGTAAGVFPGKLRPPSPGEGLVRRPRLEHWLDDGVERGLVTISAAAGSGKTQLVATWSRHQATPRDVIWVTLDVGDRDPVRFVEYVVAAIAATPSGRHATASLGALPPLASLTEPYLLTLSDAMSRLSADVVVVLDDFQAVVGSESERLLRRILRYQPERLRLIVLSRVEPALGQTRLRLQGRLVEVSASALALTHEESSELLRLHDLEFDHAEIQMLHSRTEGWPAGMHVLAASMRESADPESFVTGLGAGEAFVGDYLMAEVFEDQVPEVQQFLLRAATANPVCGELADALTGNTGGDRTLADLYQAHVFLDRIEEMNDERCTWYRWHPMFADLLRQRLRATEPEIEGQLHRTACEWYRHHGLPVEAVRQAVASGDEVTAVRLLGESWLDLVLGGESAEFHSLLVLFDESQREENAELSVACGFAQLRERDLERARGCAERAGVLAKGLPEDRRLAVDIMGVVTLLHVATMTGQDTRDAHGSALILLRQLEERRGSLTAAQKRRRALLLYHLGAHEASRWSYDEPREHLWDAMVAAGSLGMTHLVLRARAQLAFIDFFSGRLHSARESAQDVVDAAAGRGWQGHHSLATAHHVLGGVDIFRGELDAGLDRLVEARDIVHPVDEMNRFRIGFTTHIGLRATGSVRAARKELEQLQAQYRRWKAPPKWAEMQLLISEAEQLALEGHTERALELLDSVPEVAVHPVVLRHWQVFRAQLLLRSGKATEAHATLQPIIKTQEGWLVDIRALVVDALAAEALGRHEESLRTLGRALEMGAVEGVREPFLVSGRQVRPLLQELVGRGTPHEAEALDLLSRLTPTRGGEEGDRSRFVAEQLTARELEVLRALQGTASNQQIADRLFISLNTLRTHTKHIYRKLGTTSRREAVDRGRALGIL